VAETTLSIQFSQIQTAVDHFLGVGSGTALETQAIERGMRMFYAPPILPGDNFAHEWSFMKETAALTTRVSYSTGTIAYDHTGSANEREVTLTSGTWPSTAAGQRITIAGETHIVDTRVSDTILTLSSLANPGADIASGTSYALDSRNLDLPDDFGAISGSFTFGTRTAYPPIEIISESWLRALRQDAWTTEEYRPRMAAIRPRDIPAGTSLGQKFEVMWWPIPDASYVLIYHYRVLPDIIDASNVYPLGGMYHGETIVAACLAAAESILVKEGPNPNSKRAEFMERLAASVLLDRQANTSEYLGYNADHSDNRHRYRLNLKTLVNVSRDGVFYP